MGNAAQTHFRVPSGVRTCSLVVRAMLPWCLFWVAGRPLLAGRWPPLEWSASFDLWLAAASLDLGVALPLALFAAGVVLLREMGFTPRLHRIVVTVSILVGVISYGLGAWVAPPLQHRVMSSPDDTMGGVWLTTPTRILRHLRAVEANPPEEYGFGPSDFQPPPNVLRWWLHLWPSTAAFGILNILLGVLSAQLTVDLRRGRRRNTLLAIGLGSWIGFLVLRILLSPIEAFLKDGTMTSGIAAAWVPLLLPLAQALLLQYLVRRRRYG